MYSVIISKSVMCIRIKFRRSGFVSRHLVNAERYITQELKEYEEKILGAEDKILVLETQLYTEFGAGIDGVYPPDTG